MILKMWTPQRFQGAKPQVPHGVVVPLPSLIPTPDSSRAGFVYCKCDSFTHYHICIHAWGIMKLRKFIKKWPLDVTKIPKAKRGRNANITKGGALGHLSS